MKRNKKHEKRVKKLIVACGLCAVILTVSTYAWFIGMKTVNVSAFDVEIASIDGLELSLTGGVDDDWAETVQINETNYDVAGYDDNTNSWGGTGLIPMSTVGIINTASSRLTMFEKGSFTATPGGYRIMASEVKNGVADGGEANGYVAFDLFIRNSSGNKYYDTVSVNNEEAIYLTPESTVKVAATGDNEENSGIENSVRVAFAQIGRVEIGTDASTVQGISCAGGSGVLSICSDRVAQIWEPNDKFHVQNAINWYDTSCKARSAEDLTLTTSYDGTCGSVVNGETLPTYAISGEIDETHYVDTYDGAEYNGWDDSTIVLGETDTVFAKAEKGKLLKFPYFTDTMKHKEGTARPTFMTLAPKSITKVRVYVYLEGQDVDNYDFASLGKKISVAFGFTKERFYGEDIDYNGTEPKGPELDEGLQSRPVTQSVAS